jgi:hypothetical protein
MDISLLKKNEMAIGYRHYISGMFGISSTSDVRHVGLIPPGSANEQLGKIS